MENKKNMLVNTYIKIKNPSMLRPNSINHECDPENFEFKTQQKNYDMLKNTLEPYGIVLTRIHATRWSTAGNILDPDRYVFVVESNSPVVWYKYEGESYGSGQNYLYFAKKKIKLTQWLYGTEDFRNQMINQIRQNN